MQSIQLSIPKPCNENWDKMTPTEQGRFCNACAKQVVDFTTMSDAEVLNFFVNKKDENVCGRTLPQQLDRVLEAPKPIVQSKMWYWKYAAAGLLFFAKGEGTNAQSVTPYTPQQMNVVNNNLYSKVGEIAVVQSKVISGKITDSSGAAIPFASVKIEGENRGVSCDADGRFSLRIYLNKSILVISAAGFSDNKLDLNKTTNYNVVLAKNNKFADGKIIVTVGMMRRRTIKCYGTAIVGVQENVVKNNIKDSISPKVIKQISDSSFDNKVLQEVVVESNLNRRINSRTLGGMVSVVTSEEVDKKTTIIDTLKTKINNLFSPIKIYPNPINKGQQLTILFSNKNKPYTMQIVNASSVVVLNERRLSNLNALSKNAAEKITIPTIWSSGTYFLSIKDEKGKIINTAKFVVL